MKEALQLIRPTPELKEGFLKLVEEITSSKDYSPYALSRTVDKFISFGKDYELFCRRLLEEEHHEGLPEGKVPYTTYWLVHDGKEIIGESRLRHWLNERLEQEGGHIGYGIRASERNKGYGTFMLALTLEKARELGLQKALLTCNKINIASARVIEKNGGMLASEGISPWTGEKILRYWINLS